MMNFNYESILTPYSATTPLDLAKILRTNGLTRTELEIGFGNGEFTVQNAIKQPDTLLIGMELSRSCVLKCAKRAAALSNLRVLCLDARFMMKEFFQDCALDRVYMNFPCPWPKQRHANKRVTSSQFADDLAAVLKLNASFEMVTDERWYADEAYEFLGRHPALAQSGYEVDPQRPVTTKYERKWLEMGKTIYRLTVSKQKDFTVSRCTWDVGEMHIKTGNPLPAEKLATLTDTSGTADGSAWVFKKRYLDTALEKSYLIETISRDDQFEQRYYLRVTERNGDTVVNMDGTAKAYLTPAVRHSIQDLARRLS